MEASRHGRNGEKNQKEKAGVEWPSGLKEIMKQSRAEDMREQSKLR